MWPDGAMARPPWWGKEAGGEPCLLHWLADSQEQSRHTAPLPRPGGKLFPLPPPPPPPLPQGRKEGSVQCWRGVLPPRLSPSPPPLQGAVQCWSALDGDCSTSSSLPTGQEGGLCAVLEGGSSPPSLPPRGRGSVQCTVLHNLAKPGCSAPAEAAVWQGRPRLGHGGRAILSSCSSVTGKLSPVSESRLAQHAWAVTGWAAGYPVQLRGTMGAHSSTVNPRGGWLPDSGPTGISELALSNQLPPMLSFRN